MSTAGARVLDRVLLVTATKIESEAVLAVVSDASSTRNSRTISGVPLYELGMVGSSRLWLVQSEPGASTPGGSLISIHNAIRALSPTAVVMVGIAFGTRHGEQDIGDVLVSRQLFAYEHLRLGTDTTGAVKRLTRGDRVTASPSLLRQLRLADLGWTGQRVHFGLVLSGEKLIDNLNFRDQLLEEQPEAVGGEMEGVGLYVASVESRVDWIIVKGICDWADGNKAQNKDENQRKASRNAIRFVIHALSSQSSEDDAPSNGPPIRLASTFICVSVLAWAIRFLPLPDSIVGIVSVAIVVASYCYVAFSPFGKLSKLQHALAGQLADQRQRLATARLKRVLLRRLSTVPALLNANAIRSLALAIQRDLKAPPMNEILIAEIVRAIALEVEENPGARDVVRILSILNQVLIDLDAVSKDKPPLLSIARTDPVSAYQHCEPVASARARLAGSAIAFAVTMWVPMLYTELPPVWRAAISFAGLVLLCRSFVSVERVLNSGQRAHTYWQSVTADSMTDATTVPEQLDPVLDSIPFITISDAPAVIGRFSITWAPIWEYKHTMSGPKTFEAMHAYRYFQALPYADLLKQAYLDVAKQQEAGESVTEYTFAEIERLCRRMWIFTGQRGYRAAYEAAKRGLVSKVDTVVASRLVSDSGQRARFRQLHRQVQAYMLTGAGRPSEAEVQEYEALCHEMAEMTGDSVYSKSIESLRARWSHPSSATDRIHAERRSDGTGGADD
jgi:nucleoside phosphorylase